MNQPGFLHFGNLQILINLKLIKNIFEWVWLKIDLASLVMGLWNSLYLKNDLMEWTVFCVLVQIQEN